MQRLSQNATVLLQNAAAITKCDSFITKCNVYHKYVISSISSSGKASVKYIGSMQQNFNVTDNATFGMVF